MFLDVLEDLLSHLLLNDQDSTDPTIKRPSHFLLREVPFFMEPTKYFRNLPAKSI